MASRLRQWVEGVEERAFSHRWIRRATLLLFAFGAGFWPVYVAWRLAIRKDFDGYFIAGVIWEGIAFTLVIAVLATDGLPQIGRRPIEALVAFVPIVGGMFLVVWGWHLADRWKSREQRQAERQRLLEALSPFEQEVYRLRFNNDENLLYSRRRTARLLGATQEQVADADARIRERRESDELS